MTDRTRTDRLLVTFARQGLADRAQDRERQASGLEGSTAARWLARRLSERIEAVALGEPSAEPWAWTLPITRDGAKIVLGVAAYRDFRRETWNDWLIQVLPKRFALRPGLRRRLAEALRATLNDLHLALVTDPEVTNVRWHKRADLDRGREDGAPGPFSGNRPAAGRGASPAVAPAPVLGAAALGTPAVVAPALEAPAFEARVTPAPASESAEREALASVAVVDQTAGEGALSEVSPTPQEADARSGAAPRAAKAIDPALSAAEGV